ncbi:talanin [Pan troglodytes]|uniref:talanin n=1 Tax=Pan troglodytes TaxID=9598 RepID=UPI0023EFEDB8|nr:talanin [Pan troglodytes]
MGLQKEPIAWDPEPQLSATHRASYFQQLKHQLAKFVLLCTRCWNTERNQTDKNPCLHRAYLQLRETVKNKSTHLKKPLMKQAPPWKDHLAFQPLHPAERKTQVWRWQSGNSSDLETTSSASPWPTGSNRDVVLNALAESCCGLSELITAPPYAGVSIQGFSQIWVLFPFCGGTFHHNEKDVLGLQDIEREEVSTSQSRNISLLTLGQLQNCVIGKSTIIDLLTEYLLGVRHGVICFPWGLPSSG